MAVKVDLIDSIDVGNTLGEGVLWRDSDQTVWWTDIQEKTLYRMGWPSGSLKVFQLPERLGSFGFVKGDDSRIVCAFETGFALFSPVTGDVNWLARPESLRPGVRLNDGRVAPDGTFWSGSMLESEKSLNDVVGIYQLSKTNAELKIDGLTISNGISWSPSGDEMYFADSAQSSVFKCAFPLGSHKEEQYKKFIQVDDGVPDGATVDIKGRYWSAIWGGACIHCYLPDGRLFENVSVPAIQPTCVSFGGSEGNLLFVTSAREGLTDAQLEKSPKSGSLFVYKTNTCGSENYHYHVQ